jgi:cytochrome c553
MIFTNTQTSLRLLTALLMGFIAGPITVANQALAGEADADAGAHKSIFCSYCHGIDGNPYDGRAPRLAGQSTGSLIAKMKRNLPYQNFNHPMLQAFVTGGCLNDQDIRNLAAFYARQPISQSPMLVDSPAKVKP